MRVFVSTCEPEDPSVVGLIEALRTAGLEVVQSPDPDGVTGWGDDWYAIGLPKEVEASDAFVAVQTYGYDSATWMLAEAWTALRLYRNTGKPKLYILPNGEGPLRRAFTGFEAASIHLPPGAGDAVSEIRQGSKGLDNGT